MEWNISIISVNLVGLLLFDNVLGMLEGQEWI